MICKNCGETLEDGARFCTKCGKTVEQQPVVPDVIVDYSNPNMNGSGQAPKSPKEQKTPKMPDFGKQLQGKNKWLFAAVPAALALIALVIVLLVRGLGKDERKIDSFVGQKWGTSYDKVFAAVVTDDMVEGTDYDVVDDYSSDKMKGIVLYDAKVGGYSAERTYIFYDDKLIAGDYYKLTVENELISQFKDVYGEPKAAKSGDDGYLFWMDGKKNFIVMLDDEILYNRYDEEFLEESKIRRNLKNAGVDLEALMGGKGNSDDGDDTTVENDGNMDGI